MEWTTERVRRTFLEFFEGKEHNIVPSAPIVIKDDPTLMFTNAGMNQFKGVFMGIEEPSSLRLADSQKCLRVSGKHNDLEEVGRDHYHHTMFEMLGNWSFGDYFKKEAIDFAWELLIDVYGLDKERMYVTVFEGDKAMGLEQDEEAIEYWKQHISADRILAYDRKDNFWEMGEIGPCGPCSEIHYDLRSAKERAEKPGGELVNAEHPEVIEIWNLVFMQYNRQESGALNPLKQKHIDTGMGLERLVRVLQNANSNYDIDQFAHIIQALEKICGLKYEKGETQKDIAFRVIADHVRAVSFCIADGQLPSNTGAGYVIRRVLRRAIRYGFSQLDCKEPFIHRLADDLIESMSAAYPELNRQSELITKVIREEEISFLQTLEKGLDRLNDFQTKHGNEESIPGAFAFELYDTFGFPIDLTQLIASETGASVDMEGFRVELEQQKNRSRKASKASFGDWVVFDDGKNSVFLGYDSLESDSKVMKYRRAELKGKEIFQVVLDQSPFYAESGGQIGDTGIFSADGKEIKVIDTKKENNEILHFVTSWDEDLKSLSASVDGGKRNDIMKNHSATHLLHEALRSVLGSHVEQKGSLVAENKLRFDFSHFEKITEEQLIHIESSVNDAIRSNAKLEEWRKMSIEEAKTMGAMALFGEKYGNEVRVVKFGESVELCGGTHVPNTRDIEGLKIVSESSIASGIRRVEAVTGQEYRQYIDSRLSLLDQIAALFGNPQDLEKAASKVVSDNRELVKRLEKFSAKGQSQLADKLGEQAEEISGRSVIVSNVEGIDAKSAKDLAYKLTQETPNRVVALGGVSSSKPFLVVGISKELTSKAELDASAIVRTAAKEIDGGGGGQGFLATAGGKNEKGLRRALDIAKSLLTA